MNETTNTSNPLDMRTVKIPRSKVRELKRAWRNREREHACLATWDDVDAAVQTSSGDFNVVLDKIGEAHSRRIREINDKARKRSEESTQRNWVDPKN